MKSVYRARIPLIRRWLKFNAVGAMGICIQITAAYLFGSIVNVDSLWATALAVEAAVLHNFVWHEHFTWADRRAAIAACSVLNFFINDKVVFRGCSSPPLASQ